MNGTINNLNKERKFGFILREGESKDLFFHKNSLNGVEFDDLKIGDKVTFDVNPDGLKGPAAENVTLVS